jgi:hypothetical protein
MMASGESATTVALAGGSRALTEVHRCKSVATQGTAYPPMVYSTTKVLSNAPPRGSRSPSLPPVLTVMAQIFNEVLAGIFRLSLRPWRHRPSTVREASLRKPTPVGAVLAQRHWAPVVPVV